MKRMIKNHMTIRFEIEIEIISSKYFSILSSTDLTDTEYDQFIVSMIAQFKMDDYSLSVEDDLTHDSNFPGSLSQYFTFSKWIDDVQILVVVNIKVSDHPDHAKHGVSPEQKRANYVAKVGKRLSSTLNPTYVATYPLDIIFDDKHLKSFSSAQFMVNSKIKSINSLCLLVKLFIFFPHKILIFNFFN